MHQTQIPNAVLNQTYFGSLKFINACEFSTVLKKIYAIFQNEKHSDILLFSQKNKTADFIEDLEGFSGKKVSSIDLDEDIHLQDLNDLKLCLYDLRVPLHATYTFFIDSCDVDLITLKHLAKSSKKQSFVVYENECETIQKLKKSITEFRCEK